MMCLLIFIGLAYISPYILLAWLIWVVILKPIINHRKEKKREREEELKRISKQRLENYRKEAPYLFASSSDNRSRKERPAPKSEPPRLVQPVSVDKPPAPDRLTGDCSEYVAEMDAIFAGWPWNEAWPDYHNKEPYCKIRIKRAHEQNLFVLRYCATDQTATIKGSSGKTYIVSPYKCSCDDFRYFGREHECPCKHMYKLALVLFNGFDSETEVYYRDNTLPAQEIIQSPKERKRVKKQKERRKPKIDYHSMNRPHPHNSIYIYLKRSGPVTRRNIVKKLSSFDEKDVRNAILEMYSAGLIQGEKRGNRYYHWVDDD